MIKKVITFDFVLQIYRSVESLEEKEHFLGVICTFQWALNYTLFFSLNFWQEIFQ